MKKSGTVEADALRKNEKKEEILNWFTKEFDAAKIDAAITDVEEGEPELDDNELYFERTGFMKERITERFLELDDALLSDITDRLYNDIFG